MQTTFIYGLICPKTNQVKYIGKSDDVNRRLRQHIYQSKHSSNNKNLWIKSLLKEGYKPEIEVIDEVSLDDWGYWEDFWIKYYKFLGFNLINEMDGGHGYGKHSIETIKKIRESQSGEKNAMYGKPSPKGMLGKKHSDETKNKISKIKSGEGNPMFNKTGVNSPNYGKKLTKDVKEKISEGLKGNINNLGKSNPKSDETRRKISETLKGRKRSEETKRKISETLKKKNKN